MEIKLLSCTITRYVHHQHQAPVSCFIPSPSTAHYQDIVRAVPVLIHNMAFNNHREAIQKILSVLGFLFLTWVSIMDLAITICFQFFILVSQSFKVIICMLRSLVTRNFGNIVDKIFYLQVEDTCWADQRRILKQILF